MQHDNASHKVILDDLETIHICSMLTTYWCPTSLGHGSPVVPCLQAFLGKSYPNSLRKLSLFSSFLTLLSVCVQGFQHVWYCRYPSCYPILAKLSCCISPENSLHVKVLRFLCTTLSISPFVMRL